MSAAIDAETDGDLTKPGETLFAWSIFPLTMTACVGLATHFHHREANPLVALLVPLGLGYLIVIACERIYPHATSWTRSQDDVATDTAWFFTGNATGLALRPLAAFLAIPIAGWLSAHFGSGLWPAKWPLVAQLALSFVVVEFFHYWAHRWMHEIDFLWRFHATHHSAPRLYWLNANRFHVVDTTFLNLGFTVPLIALGADARIFSLWIVASAIHGLFQHANMSIRCGPLNWIFSMAELHRWHHSRTVTESNTNYGSNLILWDVVFGTRFLPADREAPKDIGIADLSAFPMTWWRQMLSPFRWSAIKRASAKD